MVRVDVEYCGTCGHHARFIEMREVILRRVPETKITGVKGRSGSFEVEVEKQLIHSKLKTGVFPNFTRVADVVEQAANGGVVRPISFIHDPTCCIM